MCRHLCRNYCSRGLPWPSTLSDSYGVCAGFLLLRSHVASCFRNSSEGARQRVQEAGSSLSDPGNHTCTEPCGRAWPRASLGSSGRNLSLCCAQKAPPLSPREQRRLSRPKEPRGQQTPVGRWPVRICPQTLRERGRHLKMS